MNRKQPQPMPEGTKMPTPPPCPPKATELFCVGKIYQSINDADCLILCTGCCRIDTFSGCLLAEIAGSYYKIAYTNDYWERANFVLYKGVLDIRIEGV